MDVPPPPAPPPPGNLIQDDLLLLHGTIVVEELPAGEGLLLPGEITLVDVDAAIVTEPVDEFDVGVGVDVTVEEEEELVSSELRGVLDSVKSSDIGGEIFSAPDSGLEEVVPPVEPVEPAVDFPVAGAIAMATDEVIASHAATLPATLPVEGIPPDETIAVDSLADKSIAADIPAADESKGMEVDDAVAVVEKADLVTEIGQGSKSVIEVVEKTVTIVEETVTTVEEIVQETGEVVAKSVTDTVKVDEVVTVNETVVTGSDAAVQPAVGNEEAMEVEGEEKGDKKRLREEDSPKLEAEQVEEEGAAIKRVKSDAGEAKPANGTDGKAATEGGEEEAKVAAPTKLGPKVFNTSVEMFTYFYDLLHAWNLNHNVNKYESLVLTELINQGNPQKTGVGISSFQIRMHPLWQSRCYYLIRTDGSSDDFSYRKCVDKLMPLPESLFKSNGELDLEKLFPGQKGRHHGNQNGGRGGGRGGRGGRGFQGGRGGGGRGGRGGGGRGRGGRWGR